MSKEHFDAICIRNCLKFKIFSAMAKKFPAGCRQKFCDSFCKCPFPETGNSVNN